jgi:hypothetical protein
MNFKSLIIVGLGIAILGISPPVRADQNLTTDRSPAQNRDSQLNTDPCSGVLMCASTPVKNDPHNRQPRDSKSKLYTDPTDPCSGSLQCLTIKNDSHNRQHRDSQGDDNR